MDHHYNHGGNGSFSERGFGGGDGARQNSFNKSTPNTPREASQVQVFVEGLSPNVQLRDVIRYFSTVGKIKLDRETRSPRVWLYKDKRTGEPTGEATITYVDRETQKLALQSYDGQLFMNRYLLKVTRAIVKSHMASPPILPPRPPRGRGGRGGERGRGGGRGRGSMRGGMRGGFERREASDHRSNTMSYGSQRGYSGHGGYGNY